MEQRITEAELFRSCEILMFHQQRLQKKFGTILLEKKLISQPELEELPDRFELHNATVITQ